MKNFPDYFKGIVKIGELSTDGVFVYDLADKRFTYLNEAFSQIFEATNETFKAQASIVLEYILSEDSFYLNSRYEDLLTTGCISNTEFRMQLPGGLHKHVSCDAYLMDDHQTIIGFVKDVTNAKKHEDYIIDYGARKDTLLDMVTHNLMGPLNLSKNVLGWIQKSITNESDTQLLSEQLHLMQESTQQCIDIVTDFLKEEHLESESIYVRKTRFDVIDRINAILEKLKQTNKDKVFRLVTHLQNLNISSDAVKFFQIIHNIVSNAIKFTPEDGEIEIVLDEADDHYIISISDNGIGIPDHLKPFIFDRRTSAGRAGLKGDKSNGVGLSIIKRLVEIMEGQIWFESTENVGTTFYVKLPKE